MRQRLLIVLSVALAAAVVATVFSTVTAVGGSSLKHENFAAPTFVPVEASTHNKPGNSVCGDFVQSTQGAENRGDLNAKTGSFLANVSLPHGSEVRRLTMFANDFSDQDAHVYLVRKRIESGLDPQFTGYRTMAKTNTKGAANGVMRKFTDATVESARIDNARAYYFLEVVVCDAVEPFAIQVSHQSP